MEKMAHRSALSSQISLSGIESQERIKVLCCFTRTIKLKFLCKLCALALKNTETLNEVIVRAHNLHNMIREMIIQSVRKLLNDGGGVAKHRYVL